MRDIEVILDRQDINDILEKDTEEKAEEIKTILYDAFVYVLSDILESME